MRPIFHSSQSSFLVRLIISFLTRSNQNRAVLSKYSLTQLSLQKCPIFHSSHYDKYLQEPHADQLKLLILNFSKTRFRHIQRSKHKPLCEECLILASWRYRMNGYHWRYGCQMILLKLWRVRYRIHWTSLVSQKSIFQQEDRHYHYYNTWTLSGFCDTSIWTYWTSIWIVTGYVYYYNLV